jgi:hypothetical protein
MRDSAIASETMAAGRRRRAIRTAMLQRPSYGKDPSRQGFHAPRHNALPQAQQFGRRRHYLRQQRIQRDLNLVISITENPDGSL